jgi:3-dehydroquinate synthase
MITLDLTLPDTRYPIHIGHGLLDQVELILPHLPIPQVAIVTNDVVAPLYLERLTRQLQSTACTAFRWCCRTVKSTRTGKH